MRKIYLFLILAAILVSPAQAQGISLAADSISKSLARQYGSLTTLQRVRLVRQQLADAVMNGQVRPIPQLLGYLAQTVPDSVPTVQPREAMALLLAAGAFRPLLKRVAADKADREQRQYRKQPLLPPDALAELADYYLSEHLESLTAKTQSLTNEEATFIRLLLEVLPRGGVSPDSEIRIKIFQQQYPDSSYGYVLTGYQKQEQVKASLRARQARQEREYFPSLYAPLQVHFDGYMSGGFGLLTGSLGDAFRLRYNFFGLGTEVGLGKCLLNLHTHYGSIAVRNDFAYDGTTYPASNSLNYAFVEISAGYRLFSSKRLALSPFVGASYCDFTFTAPVGSVGSSPDQLTHVYLKRPFTAGFILDIVPGNREKELSWLVKVRGGFREASMPLRPEINGSVFYLNIGLAFRLANIEQ